MKRALIFKTLIDVLFYGLCIGFISLIFVVPFGLTMIAQESKEVYDWGLFSWSIFLLSFIAYIILIIGIKHLRNTAKTILKSNTYNQNIPMSLKKSGKSLIISSLINYLIFILVFFKQLGLEYNLEISFDNNFLLQIIITIVGLFFIMQGDVLIQASKLKQENDLTI